ALLEIDSLLDRPLRRAGPTLAMLVGYGRLAWKEGREHARLGRPARCRARDDADLVGIGVHDGVGLAHGGERQIAAHLIAGVGELVGVRFTSRQRDVVTRTHTYASRAESQRSLTLQHVDGFFVAQMVVERKGGLVRIELEHATAEATPSRCAGELTASVGKELAGLVLAPG